MSDEAKCTYCGHPESDHFAKTVDLAKSGSSSGRAVHREIRPENQDACWKNPMCDCLHFRS